MQLNILDIICQRLNTHVRVDSWQVHLCVEKYLYQLNVCIHSDLHVCTFIFFQILVTLNIILVLSMRLLLSHLLVCQQGEKHTWLKNWVVISTGLASRLKVTMQLVIYDTFQLTYDYLIIQKWLTSPVTVTVGAGEDLVGGGVEFSRDIRTHWLGFRMLEMPFLRTSIWNILQWRMPLDAPLVQTITPSQTPFS